MSQSTRRDAAVRTPTGVGVSTGPARSQPDERAETVAVPRHRTLDGFVEEVSQADGIGLTDVDAFTTLVVQTDNSVYEITILQPHRREVFVQGGAFFPERRRACLSGRALAAVA